MSHDTLADPAPQLRLSFYIDSHTKHRGELLCEWLLEQAHSHGCSHGMIVRATAGFSRHGRIRETTFFELADDLPVKVELLFDDLGAEHFLQSLRSANINMVYASEPIAFFSLGQV